LALVLNGGELNDMNLELNHEPGTEPRDWDMTMEWGIWEVWILALSDG
jgi:hypothetical protein